MARSFPGQIVEMGPRVSSGNAVLKVHEKWIEALIAGTPKKHGASGGKKKSANQKLPRERARTFVRDKYVVWQEANEGKAFRIFWESEAPDIFNELRKKDKEAAATLRSGKDFVTTKTMWGIIRKPSAAGKKFAAWQPRQRQTDYRRRISTQEKEKENSAARESREYATLKAWEQQQREAEERRVRRVAGARPAE